MTAPLTAAERHLLGGIEDRLRRSDPALERLMSRAPGPVRRMCFRPRPLVAVIAVLTAVTAACAVAAVAGVLWALAPAAAAAVALAAAFRRLAGLRIC